MGGLGRLVVARGRRSESFYITIWNTDSKGDLPMLTLCIVPKRAGLMQ